ncbi:MAG: glycosyltransferase [Alphaproteobacteria bacterium]
MSRKPVIVFILPDLTPGGAETVLIRLMNALPRDQYEPVLVTVSGDGRLKNFIAPEIPLHSLNSGNVIAALPKLYRKIREINPDVVVSTMAHMNFAAMILRPFFRRAKFIVRESTVPECTLAERGMLGPLIRILYFMLYPLADRVIAPARIVAYKMSLQLKVPRHKIIILPNPVDIEKAGNFIHQKAHDGTIRFVAAGRLHPEKGFDRLIKALKDYRGTSWHLTLLGEGEQRGQLEHMIGALKLGDRVTLAGFQPEPWEEYASADCFLLPSRWEGLPNAALEALACGTRVIAVREAGGIVEIAAEAPDDAVMLVNSMPHFLREMGKITPARMEKESLMPVRYEKNAVMIQFQKVLQDVLAA